MKFFAVLALVAAATVVSAETNAQRLARGLSPNAPGKRATPVAAARRNAPSGTPGGQCNTGSPHCCDSVGPASDGGPIENTLNTLGLGVVADVLVGLNCSPIIGVGADCSQEPVCCENNQFNGLVNIGCSPININL